MNPTVILFCSTVLFAALASAADPSNKTSLLLTCFQCKSKLDRACGDTFQASSPAMRDSYLKSCPEKDGMAPFCRKGKYWIDSKIRDSEVYIYRGCGYMPKGRDCYLQRAEDHVSETCECKTPECNAANGLELAGFFSLALAVGVARLF